LRALGVLCMLPVLQRLGAAYGLLVLKFFQKKITGRLNSRFCCKSSL